MKHGVPETGREKLSISQLLALSMMLFALFFGAGNMIFPPAMGQDAGQNVWPALLGYAVTDVGLPFLTIVAVVLCGHSLIGLGSKAGKKFAPFFALIVYLSIGPLFAIPRTGSVSFELALMPFLGPDANFRLWSFVFTGIFFALTYFLSANPQKLVQIVGRVLTPILLLAVFIIGISAVLHPLGPMQAPVGNYATVPFFEGLIQGYQALDAFAAAVFASIVIENVEGMGIQREGNIVKYTLLAGGLAAIGLTVVYGILAYVGATSASLGQFANGGQLLSAVAGNLFGTAGVLILGIAVLFACLTTSIGLTTSFGEYFSRTYVRLEYNHVILAVCLFSFLVSNIGLTQLINITLPILLMVYPLIMALVVASLIEKLFRCRRDHKEIYVGMLIGTALISIPDGLESLFANYGIPSLGPISQLLSYIPFHELSLGWVLPAIIGAAIGAVVYVLRRKYKVESN